MNKLLMALVFLTSASCTISKEINDKPLSRTDIELIDHLFDECEGDKPGASVLVIKEGKILHNQGYGYADLEKKIKINDQTNFRIASVTKQFTAMAIMILVDQGKLKYETKLTDIFPDFPEYGNAISVRQLITHHSGLVDYYDFFDENRIKQASDREVLDSLMNSNSTYFTPGSQMQYSNTAYAVLSLIVQKISGSTFADFVDEEIFQKLGMNNSKVFEINKPIPNRAYGYAVDDDIISFNDQSVTSAIQGDGSIYCSVSDYYKWDQALYTEKLAPKELLEDAFTDWDNDTRTDKDGYGYGWYINYDNGIKELNHSGGTAGFEMQVIRIPSSELSVVIFTNRHWSGQDLWHKAKALLSIYSNYEIPMPIRTMVKKGIDQEGISAGIKIYDELKDDQRYETKIYSLVYLGFHHLRLGKLDIAGALFDKAKGEYPEYFGGYYGSALLLKRMGESEKAIQNFKKVIEYGEGRRESERAKSEIEELSKTDYNNK